MKLLRLSVFFSTVFAAERACNNSPGLCSKSYDQITHLGAHDSPFLRDASTGFSSFGNQFFDSITQLDAGARLLSTQVHVASNPNTKARELHLCHTVCELFDMGKLSDWLYQIRLWMDANPSEVVTLLLVNADGIDARELEGEYAKADIAHYGYVPPDIHKPPPQSNETSQTWPTLGEMVDKGERLVSFVNPLKSDQENAPYLLNEFDFLWENAYDVTDSTQFACTPDRPANKTIAEMRDSGRLFMMNHLLYWQQAFGIQVPDIRTVNETNSWNTGPGALGTHMVDCGNEVTRQPTFVLVDFFNVGPAIDTVDIFNKVENPVGRRSVTEEVVPGGAGIKQLNAAGRQAQGSWFALAVVTFAATTWLLA